MFRELVPHALFGMISVVSRDSLEMKKPQTYGGHVFTRCLLDLLVIVVRVQLKEVASSPGLGYDS